MSNLSVPISNAFVHVAFDDSSGTSDQPHALSDARFLYLPNGSSFEAKRVLSINGLVYKKVEVPPGFLRHISDTKAEAVYRVFEEECAPPASAANVGLGDLWIDLKQKEISYFNRTWKTWEGQTKRQGHPVIRGHMLFRMRDGSEIVRWWSLSGGGKALKEMGELSPAEVVTQALARREALEAAPAPTKKTHKRKNRSADEVDDNMSRPSPGTTLYDQGSNELGDDDSWLGQAEPHDSQGYVRSWLDVACHGGPNAALLTPTAQPMYDDSWREDVCVYNKEGIDYPFDTEKVTWFNGMITPLPFSASLAGIPVEQDEDLEAVKYIAAHGVDATACLEGESEPPVLVIGMPDNRDQSAIDDFDKAVRLALGQGRAVVVKDWKGDESRPAFDWSETCLKRTLNNLEREVVWQDASLRAKDKQQIQGETESAQGSDEFILPKDKYWAGGVDADIRAPKPEPKAGEETSQGSPIHCRGKLRDFVTSLGQPDHCGNLLDIGSAEHSRPWVVNMIADSCKARTNTERRNYNEPIERGPSKRLKPDTRAPDMLPYDMLAILQWMLVASACFITFPHQDAGGMATWITLENGIKIWVILRPKGGATTETLLSCTESILHLENLKELVDICVLFLTPGSILLQPPGLLHLVYSPIRSFCKGGHFVSWESLHHTAWSRRVEHHIGLFSTNQEHASIERYLSRMMFSLSDQTGTPYPRKSLLSLALMVLDPEAFYHETDGAKGSDLRDEETDNELNAAGKLARELLLSVFNLPQNTPMVKLLKRTRKDISATAWSEIGEYIEVPALVQEPRYTGVVPALFVPS